MGSVPWEIGILRRIGTPIRLCYHPFKMMWKYNHVKCFTQGYIPTAEQNQAYLCYKSICILTVLTVNIPDTMRRTKRAMVWSLPSGAHSQNKGSRWFLHWSLGITALSAAWFQMCLSLEKGLCAAHAPRPAPWRKDARRCRIGGKQARKRRTKAWNLENLGRMYSKVCIGLKPNHEYVSGGRTVRSSVWAGK